MANIFENAWDTIAPGGISGLFNQASQGDTIKDWDHAARLFATDVSAAEMLHPKQSFLYHVYFQLNPNVKQKNGMDNRNKQVELGMLVKQISLPKYTIDTKTLNAYNRPHIVQTKIHYDPITIQFHDDSADVVRNFWYDYYSYYYRDSDYGGSKNLAPAHEAHQELLYPRKRKDWGYTIREGGLVPYLQAIRIYSMHNKRFSEYILTNPIIKSFQHGEHSSSDSTGTLSHSMTLQFEKVHYATGKISKNAGKASGRSDSTQPLGFGEIHYDHRPSPLTPAGGGTQSILGVGGILESSDELYEDLSDGNFGAALFKGARVLNGLKGANIGAIAAGTGLGLLKGAINGAPNAFGSVTAPSTTSGSAATATQPAPPFDPNTEIGTS